MRVFIERSEWRQTRYVVAKLYVGFTPGRKCRARQKPIGLNALSEIVARYISFAHVYWSSRAPGQLPGCRPNRLLRQGNSKAPDSTVNATTRETVHQPGLELLR